MQGMYFGAAEDVSYTFYSITRGAIFNTILPQQAKRKRTFYCGIYNFLHFLYKYCEQN